MKSNGMDHEALVERLVRLAEDGPEVPANGAERIKQALRPAWRSEVRVRRRRRVVAWAAGLAAAATVVLTVGLGLIDRQPATDGPARAASVLVIRGTLQVIPPDGEPVSLQSGHEGVPVVAGTWLRTDAAARVALRLEGGQSLRLDRDTRILLASADSIDLSRGGVYIDSGPGVEGGLEIHTASGVARDIGTQFEVRQDGPTLVVRVREGTVAFEHRDADLVIAQGTELSLAEGGSHELRQLLPDSREWLWVQEVAPPFEIEGRTVLSFLDWVSRETGLWISFADPDVERVAESTVLHGVMQGLRPAEAPDVVLPGCGLVGAVEGGTLLIRHQGVPDRGR